MRWWWCGRMCRARDAPVAYYTLKDLPEADADIEEERVRELRAHPQRQLPGYMVPAAYVCLGSLPLTPNGKVDRKSPLAPQGEAYGQRSYEAPQGEVEETLGAGVAGVVTGRADWPAG